MADSMPSAILDELSTAVMPKQLPKARIAKIAVNLMVNRLDIRASLELKLYGGEEGARV